MLHLELLGLVMMPMWETSMSSEVCVDGAKNGLKLGHILNADTNNLYMPLLLTSVLLRIMDI